MSKLKMPVRSPSVDMTPMVDLFFLLLTFFMLTTSFRPQEAVQVDTPSSISEKKTPEKNLITLLISKDNKVYFNIDNGADSNSHMRSALLKMIGDYYKISFTPKELKKFETLSSFGVPMAKLKDWINASDQKVRDAMSVEGIPTDSTAVGSELQMWIHFARLTNPDAEAAIKGDFTSDYKVVKKVMDILQDKKINKFDLTTNMEKVEVKAKDIK